jgi:hypothetical protein
MKMEVKMKYIYTYEKVRKIAIKDGRPWKGFLFWKKSKDPFPPDNHPNHSPFEKELLEAADAQMQEEIYNKWAEKDRRLKGIYCKALENYNKAKARLEKESDEAKQSYNDYNEALKKLQDMGKPELSSFWKYFWLIIFALGEFPLNGLVFSIFGAGRIETYIMALAMCIGIPWSAHYIGKELKQKEKKTASKFKSIVLFLVVFLTLIVIAIMRAEYLTEMFKEIGIKGISPTLAGSIFVIINLFIFAVAAIISHEGSHPQAEEYSNLKHLVKEKKKKFEKEYPEAEQAQNDYNRAYKQLQDAKTEREAWCKKWRGEAEKLKELCEQYAQVYRTENLRARGSKSTPKWATLDLLSPNIRIPDVKELDWDCGIKISGIQDLKSNYKEVQQ